MDSLCSSKLLSLIALPCIVNVQACDSVGLLQNVEDRRSGRIETKCYQTYSYIVGLLVISSLLYGTSTYFLSYIYYPEIATDIVPEIVTKYGIF